MAVQDTLTSWTAEGRHSASVMWLYGPAGAGKSAVAQTMAETWDREHKLAAAFFFARWRPGRGSGKILFLTIAYQLALQIPQLRVPIGLAVEADPAITDKSLEAQVEGLIIRPLAHLVLENPFVVVIDGLDECDSKSAQRR
ncbi:hypothetical protein C8J57DRAFT_1116198, partial [Mycena rebaudengoi]